MARPSEEFGHYRLVHLIGAGGMGEVYLARDLALARDVAIKLLPRAAASDVDARRRLLREAQAIAQLDHPHICQVFDVGETAEGRAYIAMTYVEGDTLAERLAGGPLDVREALRVTRDIADALAAAHARGIVHRDLKPQNVIITPSGRPKLLDFGVAKLLQAGRLPSTATTAVDAGVGIDCSATRTGVIAGTPAYMSPEQVQGLAVDGRSDLFALGAVAYECVTGRRAFPGTDMVAVVSAVLYGQPEPPSAIRPDVPAVVDALCARLLAKDPAQRYQSATAAMEAIEQLLLAPDTSVGPITPTTVPLPPPGWSPALSRRQWLALSAGLLSAGTGAWWLARPRPLPTPTPEAQRWYERGTTFIREGAFHSASAALSQALLLFPSFPLAYARHAEALAELDDEDRATQQLLRMQAVLVDESRLSRIDQLRLRGIRALVLRDLTTAVDAYHALVRQTPTDAGAWLDLGRAQEAAEQRMEANASYARALSLEPGLAAAHLRTGAIASEQGLRDPALRAFAEAERLYRAASNAEGETEVLLRRGAFLDARGEPGAARGDLERARSLASASGAAAQLIRARLALGSMAVTAGDLVVGEATIRDAIEHARREQLWTLVAEGLTELGAMLVNRAERRDEADGHVQEAVRLAAQRGARRTAARATLQRASLALQRDDPTLALSLGSGTFDFLRTRRYRRLELTALAITGRAHLALDQIEQAHATASDLLAAAERVGDTAHVALALTNLAGAETARGNLPAALVARERAVRADREIGNQNAVPFSLVNRAELLIRLGRGSEAEPLLRAVDEGIARGTEGFKARQGRVHYLRALSAVIERRDDQARRHARAALETASATEASAALARGLLAAKLAEAGAPPRLAPEQTITRQPEVTREIQYWRAREALARGEAAKALELAQEALASSRRVSNDELAWRVAAVASLAAARAGEPDGAQRLHGEMAACRARLSQSWGASWQSYDVRPDLLALRREVQRSGPVDSPGRE